MSVRRLAILTLTCAISITGCKKKSDESVTPAATTPAETQSTTNSIDVQFVQKATLSNSAEIQLGKLAASKGQSVTVKSFGQMMVNDHKTALNELLAIAKNKGVSIDTNLDATHKAMKDMLMAKSGREFDSLYITGQVGDHQMTVMDFKTNSSSGKDQDIKSFVIKNYL